MNRLTSLSLIIAIVTGCSSTKEPIKQKVERKIEKKVEAVQKPKISEEEKQRLLAKKLKALLDNENMDNITIEPIKNLYKEGERLSFTIDLEQKSGYLYIFAVEDNKTLILYPNKKSPLSEVAGKQNFPSDFGNTTIKMVKNCKSCESEKSMVYALLTKEPIPLKEVYSKAIVIVDEAEQKESDVSVGKVEFVVK